MILEINLYMVKQTVDSYFCSNQTTNHAHWLFCNKGILSSHILLLSLFRITVWCRTVGWSSICRSSISWTGAVRGTLGGGRFRGGGICRCRVCRGDSGRGSDSRAIRRLQIYIIMHLYLDSVRYNFPTFIKQITFTFRISSIVVYV